MGDAMTAPTVRWLAHHPQDQLGTGGWTEYPDRATAEAHAGTTAKVWALVSPEVVDDMERVARERDELRQRILDIDAHATPYGDLPDEPGWVGTYLVTAGALHRALGKVGHSAPKCKAEDDNRRLLEAVDASQTLRRDAEDRLVDMQASLSAAEAERDRIDREMGGVREELARMAGDLDDACSERDRLRVEVARLTATANDTAAWLGPRIEQAIREGIDEALKLERAAVMQGVSAALDEMWHQCAENIAGAVDEVREQSVSEEVCAALARVADMARIIGTKVPDSPEGLG